MADVDIDPPSEPVPASGMMPVEPGGVRQIEPTTSSHQAQRPAGECWRLYPAAEVEALTDGYKELLGAGGAAEIFWGRLPVGPPPGPPPQWQAQVSGHGPASAQVQSESARGPELAVAVKRLRAAVKAGGRGDGSCGLAQLWAEARASHTAARDAAAAGLPYVLPLLGLCFDIPLCLIFPLMPKGSLADYLGGSPADSELREMLGWRVRLEAAARVALLMAFFHSQRPNPRLHGDLKALICFSIPSPPPSPESESPSLCVRGNRAGN